MLDDLVDGDNWPQCEGLLGCLLAPLYMAAVVLALAVKLPMTLLKALLSGELDE